MMLRLPLTALRSRAVRLRRAPRGRLDETHRPDRGDDHPRELRRCDGSDTGSIGLLVIGLSAVLLLSIGLVYDGGMVLAARRDAIDTAEAAARAGAAQVDPYQGALDPERARARAIEYLASVGRTGDVTVEGRTLRVVVTIVPRQVFFPMLGSSASPVRQEAEAEVRTA